MGVSRVLPKVSLHVPETRDTGPEPLRTTGSGGSPVGTCLDGKRTVRNGTYRNTTPERTQSLVGHFYRTTRGTCLPLYLRTETSSGGLRTCKDLVTHCVSSTKPVFPFLGHSCRSGVLYESLFSLCGSYLGSCTPFI